MTATLTSVIASSRADVHARLVDAGRLPEWNPAFVSLTGPAEPAVGDRYDLVGIRGLRGTFEYTRIEPDRVDMRWKVPGMTELCEWRLAETSAGRTEVTHTVSRTGPLALVLRQALADLPALRLERLSHLVDR